MTVFDELHAGQHTHVETACIPYVATMPPQTATEADTVEEERQTSQVCTNGTSGWDQVLERHASQVCTMATSGLQASLCTQINTHIPCCNSNLLREVQE